MVSIRMAAATVYLGRKTVAVPPSFVLNKTTGVLSFPTGPIRFFVFEVGFCCCFGAGGWGCLRLSGVG